MVKENNAFVIFAVEDDPAYHRMLHYMLTLDPEHEVTLFRTGKELLDNLHKKPSLITIDYSLPDYSGSELLKKIKYVNNQIPVIVISGQEDVATAITLLKEGAYDYITKDEDTRERLFNSISNAKKNTLLQHENESLKQELAEKYEFEKIIIGQSDAMKKVFSVIEKATKTHITVSITGETGTGKELVAKAIHYSGERKHKPFVAVNITAIPRELIESELFGHEKGAFTSANSRRIGKFEEANEGSIFLDEIGEMDINLQAKMLRVLQEREVVRVGGNNNIKLDVRVIVATHKNLAEEVKAGRFREDLYYRLLGLPIFLPPLRERGNDVLLIAKSILDKFCKENKMDKITITPEGQEKLRKHPFPGNVRELKAVVELAAVMATDGKLRAEDITFSSLNRMSNFIQEEMTLKEYDFSIIRQYLEKYNNNVLLVARKLDIGKSSIYRYLKEMEEMKI
ncbi:MAG TPA: sigma-54 dependent transcriptional regulator [Cytophagales bacterium]|nr:sigma-54 dependent transcriptional regulator [Cytophagales bacterium]